MKVLYSCLSRSWGGMEMFTITAAKQLLSRGYQVDILCYPGSKIHDTSLSENLNVITSDSSGYFHPKNIFELSRKIKTNKYDFIHSQASKDLWLLVPALKLAKSKIPLFLTKQMGSSIIKKDFFHRKLYSRLTTAFAISKVIQQNLLDTCPLEPEKIKLLHNAVDTNQFDPSKFDSANFRKELNIKDDQLLIGMIARFSKGKGHEEFLEAASILKEKYNNLRFVIVGEPSYGEEEYSKLINKMSTDLGLESILTFTGFRFDTPNVIIGMDIFVFPSHNEAFGIALAEALSMGIPSVCADKDGVLDIAVDGETSFLFKNKNSKDLAVKLELLITDPVKRKEFGAASRDRAIKNFDLSLLTDKVITYYNKSLASNDIS